MSLSYSLRILVAAALLAVLTVAFTGCGGSGNNTIFQQVVERASWVGGAITFASFGGNYPSLKLQNGSNGKPLIHLGQNNFRYFAASSWTTLKDGNWHHVAFTCPGKLQTDIQQAKMYLDGVEVLGYTAVVSGPQADKTHLYLGANPAVTGHRFSGQMDEVFLYDRALSQDDILKIMDQ